jgi:hypothetical protein
MGIRAGLFARHAEQVAAEALVDTRVVVVNGARQVGKSTLAELIVARSAGARPGRAATGELRDWRGGASAYLGRRARTAIPLP